jgi:preprotein translocase subunit SecF
MLDIIGKRHYYYLLSLLVIVPGIISLLIPPALRPGIDFSSGSVLSIRFDKPIEESQVRDVFTSMGHPEAIIQHSDDGSFLIRTRTLRGEEFSTEAPTPTAAATPTGENGTPQPAGAAAGSGTTTAGPATSPTVPAPSPTPAATPSATPATTPSPGSSATPNATGTVTSTAPLAPAAPVKPSEKQEIVDALQNKLDTKVEVLSFDTVSPAIASEIVRNAALAVLVASVGILLYITWAFRKVSNPVRYGTCAVIALVHDVLVVVGIFSILGKLFAVEVDAMFITALLTVIGFSVHDTIVVFDRVRENLRMGVGSNFEETVNHSILQTIGRSLTTSLTVLFTLLALMLFGGVTTRNFVLTLLIGIISGTYSSIFNASALLVSWETGEFGRLGRMLRLRKA